MFGICSEDIKIVSHKIPSEILNKIPSDSLWLPNLTKVLYMSFGKFLLAVESRDLSQADKSI